MNDFLAGRAQIPVRNKVSPRVGTAPVFQALGSTNSSHAGHAVAAQIEVEEINGRIEQIVVVCGCGERITLQCAYPD